VLKLLWGAVCVAVFQSVTSDSFAVTGIAGAIDHQSSDVETFHGNDIWQIQTIASASAEKKANKTYRQFYRQLAFPAVTISDLQRREAPLST